jgi:hypothetical protein
MLFFNPLHGRVGRLFVLAGLLFATLTALFATATLPTTATERPMISTD